MCAQLSGIFAVGCVTVTSSPLLVLLSHLFPYIIAGVLSIMENGVLKPPVIIMGLSLSPLNSVCCYFMYFDCLLSGM
jgi:hypothetical protein